MNQKKYNKISLLAEAREARQNGQIDLSIQKYERFIDLYESDEDILYELAIYFGQLGKPREAVPLFKRLIKNNQSNFYLNANLATALTEAGESQEAINFFKKSLAIDPARFELHINIAENYRRLGILDLSLESIKYCIDNQSLNHAAFCILGLIYRDREDIPRALESFEKAIDIEPRIPEYHYHFGNTLIHSKFNREAETALEEAIKLKPDWFSPRFMLGKVIEKSRSRLHAINYFKDLENQFQLNIDLKLKLAQLYFEIGNIDEAIKYSSEVYRLNKGYERGLILHHQLLQEKNLNNEANQLLDQLSSGIYSESIATLGYLAKTRYKKEVESNICEILKRPEITRNKRISLNFILGNILQDKKEWQKSFNAFSEANQLKLKNLDLNLNEYNRDIKSQIDSIILRASNNKSVSNQIYFDNKIKPIFVVGMSRAGKSWAEIILGLNKQIACGDEIDLNIYEPLNLLKDKNAYQDNYKKNLRDIEVVRSDYQNTMELFCKKNNARYFVNTAPFNVFNIDIIMNLFPDSILIFSRRNFLDLCLFNFFKNYEVDTYYYSYDLETLGHYCKEINRLMDFWLTLYPHNITEINFEDAVADPLQTYEKILNLLGLDINKDMIGQKNLQTILNKAKNYEQHINFYKYYEEFLDPLKKGLNLI